MKEKTCIIGAGAWGTALAVSLAKQGREVCLWAYEKELTEEINQHHLNSSYLMGIRLPKNIVAESDIQKAAAGADYIILATPSQFLMPICRQLLEIKTIKQGKSLIGVITKGFINHDGGPVLILEALEEILPQEYKDNLVYISGPSHAEEVAQGKLTALISASKNGKNSIRFRELLHSPLLHVFSSFDTVGVQVCAAVKNVIAIAFGMLDALKDLTPGLGDNTESYLFAAGLNEIQILGTALGSTHPETFTSIAGVGDLDVTCRSQFGRNRRFGRAIIHNHAIIKYKNIEELLEKITSDLGYLPEGAFAARYTYQLIEQYNLRMPICRLVYQILNKETTPVRAVEEMLNP